MIDYRYETAGAVVSTAGTAATFVKEGSKAMGALAWIGGKINWVGKAVDFIPVKGISDSVAAALQFVGTSLETGSIVEGGKRAGLALIPGYEYYDMAKMVKGGIDNARGKLSNNNVRDIRLDVDQIVKHALNENEIQEMTQKKLNKLAKQYSNSPEMFTAALVVFHEDLSSQLMEIHKELDKKQGWLIQNPEVQRQMGGIESVMGTVEGAVAEVQGAVALAQQGGGTYVSHDLVAQAMDARGRNS